jgi:hypothetical protein
VSSRRHRLGHLYASSFSHLAEFLLLSFPFLLLALLDLLLGSTSTSGDLHIPEACPVMMGIRVCMFVILGHSLELLLTQFAVEGPER